LRDISAGRVPRPDGFALGLVMRAAQADRAARDSGSSMEQGRLLMQSDSTMLRTDRKRCRLQRLMRTFAAWAMLACGTAAAAVETLKSEAELRPFAERMMTTVVKAGMPAAYAAMKPYLLIPESEFESVLRSSKSQRDHYGIRYGKSLGFEFIGLRKAGESLVRVVYVEKMEKHALPWTFYFYKTPSGWVLNAFHWNDQVPALFFP
jgi:hypothetical protein